MSASKIKYIGALELVVVVRMIITYIPFINYYCPDSIKLLSIIAFYLLLSFEKQFWNNCWKLLPVFIVDIFSFTLLYFYPAERGIFFTSFYAFIRPLSWAVLGCFVLSNFSESIARRLLRWFVICQVITAITTCIGCSLYPNAARFMANGMKDNPEMYAVYMRHNIGGFSFVNSLVIYTPLIVYLIRERAINRWVSIGLIVLVLITILSSEYTIALLFFSSCLILFLLPKAFPVRRLVAVAAFIIIALLLFRPLLAGLFYNLADVFSSDRIAARIREIGDSLSGITGVDSDFEDRISRMSTSWQDFKKHPIIGTGNNGGGHSFILDNLAKYGLIGVAAVIIMFNSLWRRFIRDEKGSRVYGYLIYCFIVQIGLAFVNPIFFYEPFTLVIPLFYVSFVKTHELG